MRSYWIDHDHLEVPLPAGGGKGEPIGDGMVAVTDGDPLFEQWKDLALNARPDPDPDID